MNVVRKRKPLQRVLMMALMYISMTLGVLIGYVMTR